MTRILAALAEVSDQYDALYCDLWGCLHDGRQPFPAAVAALRAFRAKGGTVLLLTNAPRPNTSVKQQLDRIGVPRDSYDAIVSSGDAAQYALITGAVGRKVHHIGPDKDRVFFTDLSEDLAPLAAAEPPVTLVPLTEAEGIVCTGLVDDLTETPDDYRATLLYAKTQGLKLLCANPDIIVDFGDKRLFCAGAIAQEYDRMGGESLYFGKPHPPIYDLARRRLAALPGAMDDPRLLAIGDGVTTDVQGALAEGIDVVFVTGGIAARNFGDDPENPDPALLDAWLARIELSATYAIGHLR
ncbi:MAG: TIGR01459 family HAD-type hydrolase [Rhodobacter sp.]|nr:TIGR01459 family HAD-type hydrolase [Rhodobacter sp.]